MPSPARPGFAGLPVGLAVGTVLLQVAYPLVDGQPRDVLTVVTVVAFFLASTSHALVHRGPAWAAGFVVVTVGAGLAAEAVGAATGFPFGDYAYADSLGWQLLGVPVVIPLAWSMMAYPCLLAGQRLCRSAVAAAVVTGFALASWDLFLDPQMVEAGHWRWSSTAHAVPGAPDIPGSNYVGWLLVATAMAAALQRLPRRAVDDRQPGVLLLWTYASSVLANAVFFGRPTTALLGGIAMGAVAIPYAVLVSRSARR